MRTAGLVVWEAHQTAARMFQPGVTTAEINAVYQEVFRRYDAEPLFLNYGDPPYPAETCISVNEEVVHGIPGDRQLVAGDIVSVDTGCRIDGWCGDAAVTLPVGEISESAQRLLATTQQVLDLAIEQLDRHTQWSDIAAQMDDFVELAGYSTVLEMCGHGIGRELHESPSVPHYLSEGLDDGSDDFEIRPGLVIAIEPMVNAGGHELEILSDGWTAATLDRSLSAHFEHTVAITKAGAVRLTGPPSEEELASLPDWLHDQTKWVRW